MALVLRARTFKDWLRANLSAGELRDLANHGADTGWYGLTYTSDTVKLFDRYGEEMWEVLVRMADDFGNKNVADLMAGFNRADMMHSVDGFKNLVVWAVAEEYAREMAGEG